MPYIKKVVLNKFDQETLNDRVQLVKDLPVKLIVNCKNSKIKNVKKQQQPGEKKRAPEMITGADDEYDQYGAAEALVTKEEVYFTGKENIEGYASLINVFIRQLSINIDNVAVINVDNDEMLGEKRKKEGMRQGELFFRAAVQFKDRFTIDLGK